MLQVEQRDLGGRVREILNRWPSVGLALGVVRDGRFEFHGHGFADIASGTPITQDTVFRIASITKTITAIAIMQLHEQGRIDLDAPADTYLRAYRLVPRKRRFRPVTVRHLLTHTAGIREVLHPSGLLRLRDLGETVKRGQPVPSLASYYRGGLRIDADPGNRFMYTDHGFATLGQIVEDVTGSPLDRWFRERIFDPLGMTRTDLVNSERVRDHRATPYELRAHGPTPVPDYDVVTVGGGGVYSTPRDMARYVAALLGGGGNEHGSVLSPASLAAMFAPQHRPDPRIPGIGLAFFRTDLAGHRVVEHDGILPGFDSQLMVAPDDGVGVVAFANGAKRGMHWLSPEVTGLMRELLGVPEPAVRTDVPHRPEIWGQLCGWYGLSAHRTDPARLVLGAGVEVRVKRGRLTIRAPLSPVPALYRGLELHPDDAADPYVFRLELPWSGVRAVRAVFNRTFGGGVTGIHFDVGPVSFERRPAGRNPGPWLAGALGGLAALAVATAVRRRAGTAGVRP